MACAFWELCHVYLRSISVPTKQRSSQAFATKELSLRDIQRISACHRILVYFERTTRKVEIDQILWMLCRCLPTITSSIVEICSITASLETARCAKCPRRTKRLMKTLLTSVKKTLTEWLPTVLRRTGDPILRCLSFVGVHFAMRTPDPLVLCSRQYSHLYWRCILNSFYFREDENRAFKDL